jgi:hypothetical protein
MGIMEGAAPRTVSKIEYDERGNLIRDLKEERIDRSRANEQPPQKTME